MSPKVSELPADPAFQIFRRELEANVRVQVELDRRRRAAKVFGEVLRRRTEVHVESLLPLEAASGTDRELEIWQFRLRELEASVEEAGMMFAAAERACGQARRVYMAKLEDDLRMAICRG